MFGKIHDFDGSLNNKDLRLKERCGRKKFAKNHKAEYLFCDKFCSFDDLLSCWVDLWDLIWRIRKK